MQDLLLTCPRERLLPLLYTLSKQFAGQEEEISVVDYGTTLKCRRTFILIQFVNDIDGSLLEQFLNDLDILDFTVYTPYVETNTHPFGFEVIAS